MLRVALIVGWLDLQSALRSRKAVLLILLFLAGSVAASGAFLSLLRAAERAMAETLRVAATERPGAMTEELMRNEQLLAAIGDLVGDPALAAELVTIPPLALFHGWVALTFVPALVMLNSTDAIAGEVESGSARFALARCPRAAWCFGKGLGQASLLGVGLLTGGLGAWVVGLLGLGSFTPWAHAVWILRLTGRGLLMGSAWLGIALGISMLVRSPNQARALGLLALIALGIGRQILGQTYLRDKAPVLVDTALQLFPGTHLLTLWQPALLDRLPAMVALPTLGGCAFLLGLAIFLRRDA